MAEPGGAVAVRVAVIDSGVHPGHPHIDAARLARGVGVMRDGFIRSGDDATIDRLGHGTAVTAAIQQWAPAATILPVQIFGSNLKASPRAVIAAVDWCLDAGVDLVNLSLGTEARAHVPAFEAVVERAHEAGVVVVAAREGVSGPCFPGALSGVLGIGLDWDCPRDRWCFVQGAREEDGHFAASGHPRPIPGVAQERNLYGSSFAVANMTGFAAALLARHPGLPRQGDGRLPFLHGELRAGAHRQEPRAER